ncbi:MAG: hypothetical protein GC160_25980 [Acidobacteria bacterium]|nr:hypothetical protein [Acidobacteriota bacterium]
MVFRWVGCWLVLAGSACAQAPPRFPVQEIAEIRELGWADPPKSVDLGLARVSVRGPGSLFAEGMDGAGPPWEVELPTSNGPHRVYRADFDANGQDDLLFAMAWAGNGRCVEGGVMTALLFEGDGRPIPWTIETQGVFADPASLLRDSNGDGRAELVTSDCAYADEMRERRWLSGIYEAQGARWTALHPDNLEPYLAVAKEPFRDNDYADWVEPGEWDDPFAASGAGTVTVVGILGAELGCNYLWEERGCEEINQYTRLRFSDGSIRKGLPVVIFDGPSGRQLRRDAPYAAIQTALLNQSPIRPGGPGEEPSTLWVDDDPKEPTAKLTTRIEVTRFESSPIEVKGGKTGPSPGAHYFDSTALVQPSGASQRNVIPDRGPSSAAPPAAAERPRGTYFARAGGCFFKEYEPTIWSLPDCELFGAQRAAAERGDPTYDDGAQQAWVLDRQARRLTLVGAQGLIGLARTIDFEPSADAAGQMVTVAKWGDGWLAQWSFAGRQWLVTHDETGAPTSQPAPLDFDGEVFLVDQDGLTFLRWLNGAQVESIQARAALEWVRAEQ